MAVWRATSTEINRGGLKLSLVTEKGGTIISCKLDTFAMLCASVDKCVVTFVRGNDTRLCNNTHQWW